MTGDALATLWDEPRWVAWRGEVPVGRDTVTKVPYAPDGRKAKADDPSTWGTRVEAAARAELIINGHGGGVGIELGYIGNDLHLAGLDLDSCLVDGNIAPWAAAILQAAQTYAEVSPSRNGIKAFFYTATEDVRPFLDRIGVQPGAWGCRRGIPGEDDKDHGPAIELYVAGRYFAVTNHQWGPADRIALLDADTLARLAPLIPPAKSTDAVGSTASADNSRSAAAFRKGVALRREGKTYSEMVDALLLDPETAEWTRTKGRTHGDRELRRIWDKGEGKAPVSIGNFYALMTSHTYIWVPTREMWPAASVNARIRPIPLLNADGSPKLDDKQKPVTMAATAWLDRHRPVEQMTWAPGLPELIEDKIVIDGGMVENSGVNCFNLYRPPTLRAGDPDKAQPWLDHVAYIYPDNAEHIFDWLAHRVQRPAEKLNHALVLGGGMGIGKDTLLEPIRYAVGDGNFKEAGPVTF